MMGDDWQQTGESLAEFDEFLPRLLRSIVGWGGALSTYIRNDRGPGICNTLLKYYPQRPDESSLAPNFRMNSQRTIWTILVTLMFIFLNQPCPLMRTMSGDVNGETYSAQTKVRSPPNFKINA